MSSYSAMYRQVQQMFPALSSVAVIWPAASAGRYLCGSLCPANFIVSTRSFQWMTRQGFSSDIPQLELSQNYGGSGRENGPHLQTEEALRLMADPGSMLLASRGLPLSMSLGPRSASSENICEDDEVSQKVSALAFQLGQRDSLVPELSRMTKGGEGDGWSTTTAGPEGIAQSIAALNEDEEGGGPDHEDDEEGEEEGGPEEHSDEEDDPTQLLSEGAAVRELMEMEEIFEVLAKVPWLDDLDVDERELRGVVAVGLLGTLEEVGWNIKQGVEMIWQGERDIEVAGQGLSDREKAALTSVMFHVLKNEREYGPPGGQQGHTS